MYLRFVGDHIFAYYNTLSCAITKSSIFTVLTVKTKSDIIIVSVLCFMFVADYGRMAKIHLEYKKHRAKRGQTEG